MGMQLWIPALGGVERRTPGWEPSPPPSGVLLGRPQPGTPCAGAVLLSHNLFDALGRSSVGGAAGRSDRSLVLS
jgi:hypothetical protein